MRVIEIDGQPWFVLADVCKVLDIGNPSQAVKRLSDAEKNTLSLNEGIRGNPNVRAATRLDALEKGVVKSDTVGRGQQNTVVLSDGNRGNPNVRAVSESGLYKLAIRSDFEAPDWSVCLCWPCAGRMSTTRPQDSKAAQPPPEVPG